MNTAQDCNELAFQKIREELNKQFPAGHFVAFDAGELIADAMTFDDLTAVLSALGKDRPDVFVAQAGVDYPKEVIILTDQ